MEIKFDTSIKLTFKPRSPNFTKIPIKQKERTGVSCRRTFLVFLSNALYEKKNNEISIGNFAKLLQEKKAIYED